MYLAPCASSAFLIAASSVFQRSSWKFDQDTPTVRSLATAAIETTLADASKAAPIASLLRVLIVFLHLRSARDRRKVIGSGAIARRHDTIPASNARAIGQESNKRIALQGRLSLITISIRIFSCSARIGSPRTRDKSTRIADLVSWPASWATTASITPRSRHLRVTLLRSCPMKVRVDSRPASVIALATPGVPAPTL